jgi:thiamine kinase-like enzyme
MIPDSLHIQRLRSLDYWRGPVAISRLSGGITNHNYLVENGGESYVARLCEERPLLGIDRRNEVVCHKAAMASGIAPDVVHHEPGLLVSRFQAGKTLAPGDIGGGTVLDRLAIVLRRLHDSWDDLSGEVLYFCPFQSIRTYARTAEALQARLPKDIDDLLDDAQRLSRRIAPFRPVLCHNDLLAANLIDGGRRIWLIDWEYGGIGHPLFDLASVCANAGLNADQERRLLAAYRGRVADSELRELRILRAASSLREALWSIIQTVASDISFDYHAYAEESLRTYRASRALLGP